MKNQMYVCERNGHRRVAELLNCSSASVTLLEDGEERVIAPTSFKRWWKPMEIEAEATANEVEEAIVPEDPETEQAEVQEPLAFEEAQPQVEETPVAEEPAQEPVKKTKKSKKAAEPKVDYSKLHQDFLLFANKMVEEKGVTLFQAEKVKGFYSFKVEGKMYMNFTLSKKHGITLWMRSKAVEGMCEYYHMVHMFDARLNVSTWDMETVGKVMQLHDASLNYQLNRLADKASKQAAKQPKSKKAEAPVPLEMEAAAN